MTRCTNSTGSESRYYFKGIVYQGSTEQDTVASSLMAIVKKILNGPSFKHQSCPLQGLLYLDLSIFQLPTV